VKYDWALFAGLSALFAGLTAVLAKMGVANVSSNLATFIRTIVILIFAFGIVLAQGELKLTGTLSGRNWTFLILSGIATGLSWLFYFAALKHGPVSHVAPIDKLSFVLAMVLGVLFLNEKVTRLTWAGAGLILVGALLTLPTVQSAITKRTTASTLPAPPAVGTETADGGQPAARESFGYGEGQSTAREDADRPAARESATENADRPAARESATKDTGGRAARESVGEDAGGPAAGAEALPAALGGAPRPAVSRGAAPSDDGPREAAAPAPAREGSGEILK